MKTYWGHPTLPFFLNFALGPLSSPATSTKHPGWRDTGWWGTPWAGGQILSSPRLSGIATTPVSFSPPPNREIQQQQLNRGRWRLCRDGRVTTPQWGTASPYISLSRVLPGWLLRGLDPPSLEKLGLCSSFAWGKKLGLFPCSAHSEKSGCWEHALSFRGHPRIFGPLILGPRRLRSCRSPHSHHHHQFPGSIRRQKGCSIFTSSWHLFS